VAAGDAAGQYQVGTKIERSPQRPFSVVDGDTIQVGTQRWRIEGYDAPEVFGRAQGQGERNAGMRAALRLQELIRTGKVEIEVTNPPDKWGRGRARLKVDGNDVAAQMKREGHVRRQSGK
jgi:micrococcal nuclease